MEQLKKILELVIKVSLVGVKAATTQLRKLSDGIIRLNQNLRNNTTEQRRNNAAMGSNTRSTNSNTQATQRNTAAKKQNVSATNQANKANQQSSEAQNKASKSTMGFGQRIATAIKWVASYAIAIQGFQLIQNTLRFIFIDSIKLFIEYEAQLKSLQAVTGATTDDIKTLSDSAIELAKSTVYTSTEIIGLQKELAKLGFSTKEIQDAQRGISAFGQATGLSLEQSAELVGKTIRAFGLSASSSERVVNTFITGITRSALSAEYLATSMQYVSSVGDSVNESVETVTGALGVLANAGFSASRAGTGLRLIFTELGSAGEPLTDVLRRLKEEGISLSEAKELVGQRGAGALLTLIKNYDQLIKLEEEATDQTRKFAAEMTILSSTSASMSQLGVVLKESAKEFGGAIANAIGLKEILIDIIELIDVSGVAGSRLRLSDFVSTLSKEELNLLLDYNKSWEETDAIFEAMVKRKAKDKEITRANANELLNNTKARILAVGAIKEEARINGRTNKTTEIQKLLYKELSESINSSAMSSKTYGEIVEITNKSFADAQRELNIYENRIRAIDDAIDKYLQQDDLTPKQLKQIELWKDSKFEAEGYKQALNNLINYITGISEVEFLEKQFTKSEEYISAIDDFTDSIKKMREDGVVTNEEKERIKTYLENIEYLSDSLKEIWGIDYPSDKTKKGTKEQLKTFQDIYQMEKNLAELRSAESQDVVAIENLNKELKAQKELLGDLYDEYLIYYAKVDSLFSGSYQQILDLEEKMEEATMYGDTLFFGQLKKEHDELMKSIRTSGLEDELKNFMNIKMVEKQTKIFVEDLNEKIKSGFLSDEDAKEMLNGFLDGIDKIDISALFFDDKGQLVEGGEIISQYVMGGILNIITPENRERVRAMLIDMFDIEPSEDKDENPLAKLLGLEDDDQAFRAVLAQAKKTLTEITNTVLTNLQARFDQEKREIDSRYSYEEKRLKAMLDTNAINQQQYQQQLEKAEKKRLKAIQEVEKKEFNARKANAIAEATINIAVAFASQLKKNLTAALIIAGLGAAQIAIIASQKYKPVQYEKGGLAVGKSHAEGGIPFTIAGKGGYELEGGEFIVNKKATEKHISLLERINSDTTPVSSRQSYINNNKYEMGGITFSGDITSLLADIRSALSKPVRAYVSETELVSKMNQRVDVKKMVNR